MILSKYTRFNAWNLIMVLALAFSLSSCREDNFDEPPINGEDPSLNVNMTIDSLKNLYRDTVLNSSPSAVVTIDSNWIVSGLVIADDKSGNQYKSIVFDDGTAGISIRLDLSNYNTDFPIGRKIFVKLKGMVIGSYAGMMQLGGYRDTTTFPAEVAPIPSPLVREKIIGGTWGNAVTPYDVTIADLGNSFKWQNRLIKLSNVQFIPADTAAIWADASALNSLDRTITDCYGSEVIVRTSGYSNFASKLTPTGSGNLISVFTIYSSFGSTTKQLVLRDEKDAAMDLGRFVIGTCPPPPAVLTSIASIRSEYFGSSTTVSSGKKIVGVVTSDIIVANSDPKNMFIQDGTAGIVVRFFLPTGSTNHGFAIGDSVEVNVGGQTLSEFNGLLQIGGSSPSVPVANAIKLGTGTVTPREVTVAQLLANMSGSTDTWESTLIKIINPPTPVTFSAPTFSTSTNVLDGTGSVLMYTRTAAQISGVTIPTPATSVTCIVSDFNGVQVFVRNSNDVQ